MTTPLSPENKYTRFDVDLGKIPPVCLPSNLDLYKLKDVTRVGDTWRRYVDIVTGEIHDGQVYYARSLEGDLSGDTRTVFMHLAALGDLTLSPEELVMDGRCKNCCHWGRNRVHEGDEERLLKSCDSEAFILGYGSEKEGGNSVRVEADEGWGFLTGPDFGCVHFSQNNLAQVAA